MAGMARHSSYDSEDPFGGSPSFPTDGREEPLSPVQAQVARLHDNLAGLGNAIDHLRGRVDPIYSASPMDVAPPIGQDRPAMSRLAAELDDMNDALETKTRFLRSIIAGLEI